MNERIAELETRIDRLERNVRAILCLGAFLAVVASFAVYSWV